MSRISPSLAYPDCNDFRGPEIACEDVTPHSTSKADLARLAHELDALVDADRSKFERDWQGEGFRHQVTSRLNEILGRPVVEDWSADLWKMAY